MTIGSYSVELKLQIVHLHGSAHQQILRSLHRIVWELFDEFPFGIFVETAGGVLHETP